MANGGALLKDLLIFTKDGEWGKGEPEEGLVEMSVIRGTDFESVRFGDPSNVPVRYIPEHIAVRKSLQPSDILLETAGGTKDQPTGRTVFLKKEFFETHQRQLFTCASFSRFLRVNTDLADPEYVYWYLKYLYFTGETYVYHVQHTGVARFQYTEFASKTEIPLPPFPTQRAIARILGALDDKIELNRRQNATLEALARAIFKSWFIDFDPVHARAAGRAPTAMEAATAALFPDGFDVVDGREVPRGWEVTSLDNIASFLNGLALQKFPPQDDDYLPVIKIAQMRKDGVAGADKASPDIPSAYVVQDGDVLFSWSGSLEVMIWCGGRGALNQHLFKVTSNQFQRWFYYLWIKHHLFDFQAIAASKVTTMGHIQRHHLSEAAVVIPSDDVLSAANGLIGPLIEKLVQNKLQSRTLASLRDTLLPKLLSGELHVRDVERLVEEQA
jgi:type I restriction enzyme S subunit